MPEAMGTFKCPAFTIHQGRICDDFTLADRVGPDLCPIHYWETTLNCPFKAHESTNNYYSLSNESKKKDANQYKRMKHFTRGTAYP